MEKIGCGMAMANTWTDPPMVLLYAFVAFFASWVVLPALSYVCFVAYGPYGLAAGPAVIGVSTYYQFVAQHAGRLRGAPDLHRRGVQEDVGQEEGSRSTSRLRVPRRQDPLQEGLPRHAVAHRDEFIDWRRRGTCSGSCCTSSCRAGATPSRATVVVAEGRGVDDEGDRRALRPQRLRRLPRCAPPPPRNWRRAPPPSTLAFGAQFGLSLCTPSGSPPPPPRRPRSGTPMIYTSAFYHGTDHARAGAEQLNMLCNKVHLKKGDKPTSVRLGHARPPRRAEVGEGARRHPQQGGRRGCRAQNDKAKPLLEQ